MTRVILQPRQGLCNRWLALLGGLGMAKGGLCDLQFTWERCGPCAVPFKRLWSVSGAQEVSIHRWYKNTSPEVDIMQPGWQEYPEVRIRNFKYFQPAGAAPLQEAVQMLQPTDEVLSLVDGFFKTYGEGPWCAVCLRRRGGSTGRANPYSLLMPDSWLQQRMDALTKQDPELRFLVIGDTPTVEGVLLEMPRTVALASRTFDPFSSAMVVQSLAWILLATKMRHVLGSPYSTMVEMPKYLDASVVVEQPSGEECLNSRMRRAALTRRES